MKASRYTDATERVVSIGRVPFTTRRQPQTWEAPLLAATAVVLVPEEHGGLTRTEGVAEARKGLVDGIGSNALYLTLTNGEGHFRLMFEKQL